MKIIRRIIPYILGILLILLIGYYVGFYSIINAFENASLWIIPFIFLLEIFEYLLQVYRANYIFNGMGHDVSHNLIKNYAIGHAIAFITPQRALGEVARSYTFKRLFKLPLNNVLAFISVERILDVFLLGIIVTFTSYLFVSQVKFALLIGVLFSIGMVLLVLGITSTAVQGVLLAIGKFFKINLFKEFVVNYVSAGRKVLFNIKIISFSSLVTAILWFIDFLRVYLIFVMFGYNPSIFIVAGIISLSYLLSIVFILPGGLGVFEGGATAVFTFFGIPAGVAFSAIFVERLFSYWLWIIIGFYYLSEKVVKPKEEKDFPNSN